MTKLVAIVRPSYQGHRIFEGATHSKMKMSL